MCKTLFQTAAFHKRNRTLGFNQHKIAVTICRNKEQRQQQNGPLNTLHEIQTSAAPSGRGSNQRYAIKSLRRRGSNTRISKRSSRTRVASRWSVWLSWQAQNRRQKVFNRGLYVCVRGLYIRAVGDWHSNLTKMPLTYSISNFNFGGLGAFFGKTKPTKAPRGDGTGQESLYRRYSASTPIKYQTLLLQVSNTGGLEQATPFPV